LAAAEGLRRQLDAVAACRQSRCRLLRHAALDLHGAARVEDAGEVERFLDEMYPYRSEVETYRSQQDAIFFPGA
jgi:hypothetical protein